MSSDPRQNLDSLISEAQKFLRAQQELFGSTILISKSDKQKNGVKTATAFSSPDYSHESWASAASLEELNRQICACMNCPLGSTRTKFVFGVGNPAAEIMFVGEGPGADEDRLGEPFVGRAGQLLNKIL